SQYLKLWKGASLAFEERENACRLKVHGISMVAASSDHLHICASGFRVGGTGIGIGFFRHHGVIRTVEKQHVQPVDAFRHNRAHAFNDAGSPCSGHFPGSRGVGEAWCHGVEIASWVDSDPRSHSWQCIDELQGGESAHGLAYEYHIVSAGFLACPSV